MTDDRERLEEMAVGLFPGSDPKQRDLLNPVFRVASENDSKCARGLYYKDDRRAFLASVLRPYLPVILREAEIRKMVEIRDIDTRIKMLQAQLDAVLGPAQAAKEAP